MIEAGGVRNAERYSCHVAKMRPPISATLMAGMAVEASLQGYWIQAPYPQMDEYYQPDVDYDAGDLERTGSSKSRRGTKGNRTAQWLRWRARNKARRNDYNKRWMANARRAYRGF